MRQSWLWHVRQQSFKWIDVLFPWYSIVLNFVFSLSFSVSPSVSVCLSLSLPLTYIYNLSFHKSVFPTVLKKEKVIPLSKVKDLGEPNNFRPISILPLLSKPIERHVHKHLLKFLNERDLLSLSQSGFRPKHSCHTTLTKLFDNWLTTINNSEVVDAVFLDLKKAFDLVNHNNLIKKLFLYTANSSSVVFF